jgi:tRNA dimethylallyltransferase
MKPLTTPDALVITGPTGVGKSALAVELAEALDGEIISADSRQVYRHMDIGTAKPAAELRRRVPHHGLNLLEPDETYSAGRFARDAWATIEEIRGRRRVPIIVGGTGFFIRALLVPLGPEPTVEAERRARLRGVLSGLAVDELHRWLRRLDPPRAEQLKAEGGRQRLARSLEVVLASGRSHSWWLGQPSPTEALNASVFCVSLPQEELYRRIDERLDRMMASGLLDEVRRLLERFPASAPGLQSVGYIELIQHLHGDCSLREAVDAAKRSTRRYARRQMTWFRHQLPGKTVWLEGDRPRAELLEEIARGLAQHRTGK